MLIDVLCSKLEKIMRRRGAKKKIQNYQIVGETGASEKGSSWMENIAGVLLTQKNEVARGGFQMVDSAFANSGLLLSPSSGVSSMATGGVRSCELACVGSPRSTLR